jgi:hypothetical protein
MGNIRYNSFILIKHRKIRLIYLACIPLICFEMRDNSNYAVECFVDSHITQRPD